MLPRTVSLPPRRGVPHSGGIIRGMQQRAGGAKDDLRSIAHRVMLERGLQPDFSTAAKRQTDAITRAATATEDRKSTRLNSSHPSTSYAVFCLKKKRKRDERPDER